jgi:hypothetical protein
MAKKLQISNLMLVLTDAPITRWKGSEKSGANIKNYIYLAV